MNRIIILFSFFSFYQSYAQWGLTLNQSEKKIAAIGEFVFNINLQDTIILNLSKSRKLGLDLAIEGDYFKNSEKYYVLFEVDERKIKVLSSLNEKGRLRVITLKDLNSNQEYEIQEFLSILKKGYECVLTINNGYKIIQGFNKLIGSENAINKVVMSNYP